MVRFKYLDTVVHDNYYFVEVDKLFPEKVPYDAFWGDKVEEEYIKKYGANETGF